MAVDVKSLRVGSHILVNGKYERVRGLDEDNGLITCGNAILSGKLPTSEYEIIKLVKRV